MFFQKEYVIRVLDNVSAKQEHAEEVRFSNYTDFLNYIQHIKNSAVYRNLEIEVWIVEKVLIASGLPRYITV